MNTIARSIAKGLLPLLVSVLPIAASAEDAKSLAIGAPIKDGALTIGSRTWTLPPGDWKLAGRNLREVKLTEIRSGAEVIEVYAALIQEGKLRAGLMMTGPTAGTRVNSWREDPACRTPGGLYREDSSSATLSDCLVIRVFPAHPVKVPGAEVYDSTATWMQSAGVATPRPVINVLIVKYQGDEYFRASSWFDPAEFGLKSEELSALTAAPEPLLQWARAYRAAVAKAMGSTSGTFAVPPLPAAR